MKMLKELVKNIARPILTPLRPGNVVMIHFGRSGSTVLANLLREHPRILWRAELYNPYFLEWAKGNNGIEIVGKMPEDGIAILKRDMKRALHRYYGFELKPFHLRLINYEFESFFEILDSLGFTHYILLERENRLRKVVSSLIAHQNIMRYHIGNKSTLQSKSVHIDVNSIAIDFDNKPLIKFLEDYDKELQIMEKILSSRNSIKITYEKHIQENPIIAYYEVCNFLNLKARKPEVSLSRTNPFPLSEMIDNFEEVSNLLKGTAYEWMLEH